MKTKSMIGHGCWAVVALVAFWMGSVREPAASDGGMAAEVRPVVAAPVLSSGATGGVAGGSEVGAGLEEDLIAQAFGKGLLGRADWEALARQAVRDPNPISRRLAFGELLRALTPENALEIREQLVAFGLEGDAWRDFNYSWGALAGEEAIVFAASSEESDLRDALSGWASANPGEAIAFLDNLPEEMKGERGSYAESIVAGLADRGAGEATDFVFRLAKEGGGGGEKLMELVADKALKGGGLQEAAAWSAGLPDGSLKGAAMGRVADAFAKRDPEGAARWAERFAERDFAARAIEEVSDGWARRSPVEAVTWLESLPAGAGQVAGLTSVFGDWEDRDPLAASEYLLSMPQSAKRDSAISGFSRGYAWQDPEAAITWAQDIGDPALREQTLTSAGRAYMRRQPDSALVWLESSGLPAEAVEQILAPERRR